MLPKLWPVLLVWPAPDFTVEAVYDLSTGPILEPRSTNGPLPPGLLPPLDATRVFFTSRPVSWRDWVSSWQRDQGLIQGESRQLAYALLP